MRDTIDAARKALLLENQPEAALAVLNPYRHTLHELEFVDQRVIGELIGLSLERAMRLEEASAVFLSIGDYYQSGYCRMLAGQPDQARTDWEPVWQRRNNHWSLTLHGMITRACNTIPTYLQVRNYLEADIINLARAGQKDLLFNVLYYTEFLSNINFEAFKFVGRALYHAGQYKSAGPYLLQSQKLLPNDPEIYYHLGQYYEAAGQLEDCVLMLHQCLLISGSYTPAREMLARVQALTEK